VKSNVEDAVKRFGITYPVVLDNEYKTWNALGNVYWPRKYLVDIDGYIVYDHAGEGNYDETERAIQKALLERAQRLNISEGSVSTNISNPGGISSVDATKLGSPEMYFGSARNEYFANGERGRIGVQTLTLPSNQPLNFLLLGGAWNFQSEYAEGSEGSDIVLTYQAKNVYFVGSSNEGAIIEITKDGAPVGSASGSDVDKGASVASIKDERLYTLIEDSSYGQHTIRIHVKSGVLKAFTFTFG